MSYTPTGGYSGTDAFTVQVSDGVATSSTTVTVTVNPIPTISCSPVAICIGSSSPLTTTGASTYTWSPGTGLSATNIANPTANPTATTTYTITGTSTDGCVGTGTVVVTVNPIPTISCNPVAFCNGLSAPLSASGASTYTWSPGTGLSATNIASPTANPTVTTTYTITGTSVDGCVGMGTVAVTVYSLTPVSAITGTLTVCEAANTTLADATGGGVWSSSNTGIANVTAGVVHGVSGGTATISYTVTNSNGCVTWATAIVTVNPLPVVNGITGTLTVCAGSNVTLSDATAGGTWTSGTTSVATVASSGMVHGRTAGTTNISYSVTNGCGTTVQTVNVVVYALPVITITSSGDDTIRKCGSTNATITVTGASTYTWAYPSGGSYLSSTTGASVVTSTPTNPYTYTVTGSDANGCVSKKNIWVKTKVKPFVNGIPNGCVGITTILTGFPNTTGGTGTWITTTSYASTTISGNTAPYTGLAYSSFGHIAGIYQWTHTLDSGTCYGSVNDTIYIIDVQPVLTAGSGIIAVGTSTTITASSSGTWSPVSSTECSLSCSGCTPVTVNGLVAGTRTITYTRYNGYCTMTPTISITVTGPKGVNSGDSSIVITDIGRIKVYPNPNSGTFVVELPEHTGIAVLTIRDYTGKVIDKRIVTEPKPEFDISKYPRGLYLLNVDMDDRRYNEKILVQ